MDVAERERYEKESQDLRVQLKTWENTWAKEHEGKKPSRDAIKQNPDIGMLPSRLKISPSGRGSRQLELLTDSALLPSSSPKVQNLQQTPRYHLWQDPASAEK